MCSSIPNEWVYPQAFAAFNQSLIQTASPASQPELVRQKTWSIGSIHDLEDARVFRTGPTRTSSPVQSLQVTQNLEELSLQVRDSGVTRRLEEACEKIREAMLMLNSNKDKNVTTYSRYYVSLTLKPILLYSKSTYILSRGLCVSNFEDCTRIVVLFLHLNFSDIQCILF